MCEVVINFSIEAKHTCTIK